MISNGIDGILAFFEQHSVIGMMNLQPHAEWMIYTFAIIDLALTYCLSPNDTKFRDFILKTFRYGFFLFVIRNFQDVANMLFKTFAMAGSVAATGSAGALSLSPGALWSKGFDMVSKLFGQCFNMPILDMFGTWLLCLLAIAFTAIATFKMVFQFLEMKIEFCIFSSMAIFYIPFTCINQLSFLFQRIVTGFFSSLTKIMVMYFMLALVEAEITNFSIAITGDDITIDIVNYALRFLVLGLIVANLPQFAANIMSGSSAMGGSIGSFATGMAVGAMKAPIAATAMAAGGVQQYKDRIEDGQTKTKAAKNTTWAIAKDLINKATGDPAGKIWFPNYDRGHSQTLRRSNPFENRPKQKTPAEVKEARFKLETDTAKNLP